MKDVVRNQCHLNFCAILVSKWESSICGRILMSCPVVTLWFGLLTKGGVAIITSLPHHHHHHVDILTSGGDSMQHVEGKVVVRFVEFKYRDDIHILLVTSWLRKQRRDIRKTRKIEFNQKLKAIWVCTFWFDKLDLDWLKSRCYTDQEEVSDDFSLPFCWSDAN